VKSLFHHLPHAIEQNAVRSILELHQDCLVTFLMPKPNHPGKDAAVGTGFFVLSGDPSVVSLFTAKHVFDDFDTKTGRITVGTVVVKLGNVGQLHLADRVDFAHWMIPAHELVARGVEGIHTLPLLEAEDAKRHFEPTSSFVVIGYPGSKNASIDYRPARSAERAILGLALHESTFDHRTGIRHFPFTGKTVPEAWRPDMVNKPSLKGVSGSPCLRVVIERSSGRIGALLAGVFYAWNKQDREIKVLSMGDPWERD
jgi:hypothetical protein